MNGPDPVPAKGVTQGLGKHAGRAVDTTALIAAAAAALRPRAMLAALALSLASAASFIPIALLGGAAALINAQSSLSLAWEVIRVDAPAFRWGLMAANVSHLLGSALQDVIAATPLGAAASALLILAAWTVLGGAITRQGATIVGARREPLLSRSLAVALRRAVVGLLALAGPAAAVSAACLLGGALLTGVWETPLRAPSMVLVIAGAIVLAFAALAYFAGAPLMTAAAVLERGDAFDTMQRPMAYAVARPLRLALCWLIAAGAGSLVAALVWLATRLAVVLVHAGVRAFSPDLAATLRDHAGAVGVAMTALPWAAASVYFLSLLHTAAGGIYLLMREAVDGRARDVIAL